MHVGEAVPFEGDAAHDAQEVRSGSASPIACAQSGMPRNGNMKPDRRMLGRKKMVIWP